MAKSYIPELNYLLSLCEKEFGGRLSTANDYIILSDAIEKKTTNNISDSTLKRLWGYVSNDHMPRISSLDTLSKYIGYADFEDFCQKIRQDEEFVSGFVEADAVFVSDISEGKKITLGWNPNRLVEIEYLGEGMFRVLSNRNSKLKEGTMFKAELFVKGRAIYLHNLIIDGKPTGLSYIAGRSTGLTILRY